MIRYPSSPFRENECAVALVIVLAFVVLITGVVIAFFSNSLLYRQISNSSANATKVDLFAQGAMDAIVGDLKQEIAAGSNATMYTDTNGNAVGQVYRPFNPNTAIPAQALSANASAGLSFASNLVKRSAYGQNFFPSGSDPGSASYNNGNTSESIAVTATPSASPSPAPKYLPSNRAAKSSTLSASQNGRFISLARWNKALLLPKVSTASDTDFTPVSPANGTSNVFVAPDWVLVARDGSNPTGAFNGNMASSSTAASSVIGRYAYAIYDEGGLLDMNAAGYPTDASGKSDSNVVYKAGLPFADLTQLPGISALSSARQKSVVNSLVGWRNYASAQLTGGSLAAGFTFSGAPLTNFTTAMWGNTTGFLKTANTTLPNGQSDRMFVTRQEMMNLLVQGIASSGGQSDRANVQNALQYLTSYSRTINQPSFVPATFSDPAAPVVADRALGGNNATGLDKQINPSFLNVRAQGTFTRNDGTQASIGEPLVKKRFALNRLAWLTFKGPLSDGLNASPTTVNADATIQGLAQQLHDTYGLSWQFLQQGTAANIQNYFGLEWKADSLDNQSKWFYDYHNGGGTPATGSKGAIMKLGDIAKLGNSAHEPDFFELLKAGINVGSLGKSSSTPAVLSQTPAAPASQIWQYNRDIDVDLQLVQTAANIIDQFDLDGYPTRIVFDNDASGTSNPQEFRGVENLPYIYRVRYTCFKARMSVPDTSWYYSGSLIKGGGFFVATGGVSADAHNWATNTGFTLIQPPIANGTAQDMTPGARPAMLTNPGLEMSMVIPDIWNPHDQNASRGALDSSDNPLFPTSFRVVAQSAPPAGTPTTFTTTINADRIGVLQAANNKLDTSLGLPLYTDGSNGWASHSRKLTTSNSGLYFTIDKKTNGLFHEPTALFKVGYPTGSLLSGLDPTGSGEDNALIHPRKPSDPAPFANDDGNLNLFASGSGVSDGLLEDPNLANGYGYNPNKEPVANQKYLGVYLGGAALACKVTAAANVIDAKFPANNTNRDWVTARNINNGPNRSGVTYLMQCLLNGKWVTYDEKYADWGLGSMFNQWVQDGSSFPYAAIKGFGYDPNMYRHWLDPRTSRFGSANFIDTAPPFNYTNNYPACLAPGSVTAPVPWPTGVASGVLDQTNWVTTPERPDFQGGRTLGWPGAPQFATAAGWYPNTGTFQPELFSQNRSDVFSDNRGVATDTGTPPASLLGQYYTDADGVLRRAEGAYVKPTTSAPAPNPATGVPQVMGDTISGGVSTPTSQSQSRPFILNRPFRSVTELGYTFSGTPWRNLDFFTPESGSSALLDVFCINDTDDVNGLVAGEVNLNTRQTPVLQAVLSGGYKDETSNFKQAPTGYTPLAPLTTLDAQSVAKALVQRTTPGATTKSNTASAPLLNLGSLVGQWTGSKPVTSSTSPAVTASGGIDGSKSYDGLSKDLDAIPFEVNPIFTTNIQRFRESAIRPLANVGQTRVWNLMIDLLAQTGRYPVSASSLDKFTVEGEQRYWLHLAVDRYTGQVIDKQIEVVKE